MQWNSEWTVEEKCDENSLGHSEIKKAFLHIVNLVQPEHPYKSDPYPVEMNDVDYSYKKNSSDVYASCGPRGGPYTVSFTADKKYFNKQKPERILAILAHEITHIVVGTHSDKEHGSHPPQFWREAGYHCHLILDEWDSVREAFGNIDKGKFIVEFINEEVNEYNIDRRYSNVREMRNRFSSWFIQTLEHNQNFTEFINSEGFE